MLRRGLQAPHVCKLGLRNTPRQWTGVMNQQLPHQVGRQTEERGLLIGRSVGAGGAEGLDLDELEIELMNYGSGLQGMVRPLRLHARGGDPAQFGVKEFDQAAGGLMVSVTKARHQPGYGFGLEREWGCHFDSN